MLEKPASLIKKKSYMAGVAIGASGLIMFITNAAVFYIGAIFIDINIIDFESLYTVMFAILMSAQFAGRNNNNMGDVGAAMNSGKNIFAILDQVDEFQRELVDKSPRLKVPIKGNIEFKNVYFKYPSREH